MRLHVLAALTVAAVAGCRDRDGAPAAFLHEVRRAQHATVHAGATAKMEPIERGTLSIAQEWTVEIADTWDSYREKAAAGLEPSYRCSETPQRGLICSRYLPGDHFQLTVSPAKDLGGHAARVRLEARPD